MKECIIDVIAEMPEHVDIRFESTGFQGGDAGHGGTAMLKISWDGGAYMIGDSDDYVDGPVIVTACGDWEIEGLTVALIKLGKLLEQSLK